MPRQSVGKLGKKVPVRQDDLFDIQYVADAVLSPDGRAAVYVLAQTRGKGDKEAQRLSIWLVPSDGSSKPRQLTRGKGNSYHPRFSPDGSELFFLSSRTDVPQIYALPLDGGEPEQLTDLPQGAGAFDVAPDGRSLVFSALADVPTEKDENQHQRIDQFWYRFDPIGGYLGDVVQTVFLMKRGGKPKSIIEPGGIVLSAGFSPDGQQIAVLRTALPHHKIFETDISLVAVKRGHKQTALVQNLCLFSSAWNADGSQLLCIGPGRDLAHENSLFTVNVDNGSVQDRTRALDLMVGSGLQNHVPLQLSSRVLPGDDARVAYTTITRGGELHVNRVTLAGRRKAEPLSEGQCLHHLMDRVGKRVLTIGQSFNEPPALFVQDEETGASTQLTHHNDAWQSRLQWPEVERIKIKSARNVEVEGWVLKPKGARAPYRTILTIHGGPHAGYGCGFWGDLHELVGAGYAIAFMNPRGSTGYGNDFCRSILGRWGDPELRDFNAFLDHLVQAGIAHPERLGVTGISGGGHLSAWLIGHTDRFKAAVPEQGVYSMISMWGTSDAGRDLLELEMGGTLHKIPMKYWNYSPLAHAHKCSTPTLLLQGENDIRCPMEQAEQLFAKLKHHGCEAELIPMKRCRHGEQVSGRPALRRFRMDVMKEWFDRHIR